MLEQKVPGQLASQREEKAAGRNDGKFKACRKHTQLYTLGNDGFLAYSALVPIRSDAHKHRWELCHQLTQQGDRTHRK